MSKPRKEGPQHVTVCPACHCDDIRTVWAPKRKLQKECRADDCNWKGAPYAPPRKPVVPSRVVSTGRGGWEYTLYDQYGHVAAFSRSYGSQTACHAAALRDIEQHSDGPVGHLYGECKAVVWPPTVRVQGTLVQRAKPKRRK